MSKRWTLQDDIFLVKYASVGLEYVGQHDLGRAQGAATKRAARLKETGLWDKIEAHFIAEAEMIVSWHESFGTQSSVEDALMFHGDFIDKQVPASEAA